MKEMDKTSREYKLLKSHWKLYLKKYKELEGTHQVYNRSLRAPYTQSQIVSEGLQCDETLENTYNFMQDFMYALKYKDPEKIEELLSGNTRQYCPQLRTTIRSFRRSFRAVLNGATLPFSNGCLEGLNRKIKQIERTAYGYSNFTHLLKRIRLEQNLISLKKSAKRLEAVQHSH
jgi:transposase